MDTATVFELRKAGRLSEALNMALALYRDEPYDKWTQKALAWTLIDHCKNALIANQLSQAQSYYNQIKAINFSDHDDILNGQINYLQPRIDAHFTQIQAAETLSKNGVHKQALADITAMFRKGELLESHHESFGWIIYRYIKAEELTVASAEIRTLMRDYLNLKNDRPSLLHSVFLNFALHFSKTHADFNLYSFFLLWEPEKFTTR